MSFLAANRVMWDCTTDRNRMGTAIFLSVFFCFFFQKDKTECSPKRYFFFIFFIANSRGNTRVTLTFFF